MSKKPARELPKLTIPCVGGYSRLSESDGDMREVEVLTLNINTGSMRVRFTAICKYTNEERVYTINVPNDAFFEKYQFTEL